MAVLVAWLYGFHPRPESVVRAPNGSTEVRPAEIERQPGSGPARLLSAFALAGDELLEMGRYLVVGAAAAAILRTVIPGPAVVAAGQGAIVSVPLTMALAALLSICSVVDAFVALSLTGLVSSGAMLAFLVFGPVVDTKSVLLYGTVFRWRTVMMLVILLTQISLLIGLAVSLHVG
jgi:uncharacterized membrane protein YraQ (UPF0718 family)